MFKVYCHLSKIKEYKCLNKNPSKFFSSSVIDKYYAINPSSSLLHFLKQIDDQKEELAKQRVKTNDSFIYALNQSLNFKWIYNSNAIEGNRLSLSDTIFFLQEGITVAGKYLNDFIETRNHAAVLESGVWMEIVREGGLIDPFFLKDVNTVLLHGIQYLAGRDQFGTPIYSVLEGGEYKNKDNFVFQADGTKQNFVFASEVPHQMDDLCEWIATMPHHPIIVSAIAHYNMGIKRIHPFQDGNGRGARILMNAILLRSGYYPAIIQVTKRSEYIGSIKKADEGQLESFIQFVAESVFATQNEILESTKQHLTNSDSSI